MLDILIIGSGITAATICALCKHKYKILVVDIRDHIGGNCYDYSSNGGYIHRYGPHIFHSKFPDVVDLLSNYTEWIPYQHTVEAEIEPGIRVPFPYSKETAAALGKTLNETQVIDTFFKPYSQKMWGTTWDELPSAITRRIPKDTKEVSNYFEGQFTALPKRGYTKMMNKMLQGVDIMLGVDCNYWQGIPAKKIIYCGRPDHIQIGNLKLGAMRGDWLQYRNLDFTFKHEPWDSPATVVNFCHLKTPYTRKSYFGHVYKSYSKIVTYETPKAAMVPDKTPFYPIPTNDNTDTYLRIRDMVKKEFPNMILAGRLGTNAYIDMDIAVKNAITLVKESF
jgi:UDP-galactopyranose mutase